jgi:hypothetical protein
MDREPSFSDYDRRAADVPHSTFYARRAEPEGDRRTRGRRGFLRREEDRRRYLRSTAAMAFGIAGGLVVVYLFFAAIGAVDPGDAAVASIVAIALALIWLVGVWIRIRTGAALAQRPDRERRGF